MQIFFCEEHNAGGRTRAGCPACKRECDAERDNGYLLGWEDARATHIRVHDICGLFWGLHIFCEAWVQGEGM